MKVSVTVELDIDFFTDDGEELDTEQLQLIATQCLRDHLEYALEKEEVQTDIHDSISNETDMDIRDIIWEVK